LAQPFLRFKEDNFAMNKSTLLIRASLQAELILSLSYSSTTQTYPLDFIIRKQKEVFLEFAWATAQ
jgi:hypothetical protein